jgi:YfiR/HmsC-like
LGLFPLSFAQGASDEASVRVAFVFNFFKFGEWPNQAASSSLRLCALGADRETKAALAKVQGKRVTETIDGKTVVKQAVEVVFLDNPASTLQELKSCHILYRPLHATPIAVPDPLPEGVLFVADEPQASERNVGIALARTPDGRIEFSVSLAATKQSGVIISSQLLRLAKSSNRGGKL